MHINRLKAATSSLLSVSLLLAPLVAFALDAPVKRSKAFISVVTPPRAQAVPGDAVTLRVRYSPKFRPRSLRIHLNGKPVTKRFIQRRCSSAACVSTATVGRADGVVSGKNTLLASIKIFNPLHGSRCVGHKTSDRGNFLVGDSLPTPWLPSAIGLTLNPGGALPWVTINTGTPADNVDTSDLTMYSLPFADATFPTDGDPSCSQQRYQVLVLNRQSPLPGHTYSCYGDSASLKAYLAGLDSTNLVIVGTSLFFNADPGLDTSSIGGTDYSATSQEFYPQGYAAIGVPGAAAGSAYESFYISSDQAPLQRDPFASGILAQDAQGNYNFYSSDIRQFQVITNDPSQTNNAIVVWTTQSGGSGLALRGYNPPFVGDYNGFWLLALDRVTLEAVDVNPNSNCWYNQSGLCGTFYNTGSTDPDTATAAVEQLSSAIQSTTYRQLIFLIAIGQPLQSSSYVTPQFISAVEALGGSSYTLAKLTTPGATYTIVAPGIVGSTETVRSPFSRGLATSTSIFSQQGQTGLVRGVLERDPKSLYQPTLVNQEDGKYNGSGATGISLDFSLPQIAGFYPIAWPLTDTRGHIAAYHYVSGQYLTSNFGETGSHSEDLRFFYAGEPTKISQYHSSLNDVNNANCLATQTLPSDVSFTLQDLCDARAQLYQELLALYNTDRYLGDGGLGGILKGIGDSSSIAGNVISEVSTLLNGQFMVPKAVASATGINAKIAEWMNFASAIVAVSATAVDPEALPEVAGAIGGLSGGLKVGSTFTLFDASSAPLSYENGFDVTLGELENNAQVYTNNLVAAYEAMLDMIYSDWGKLQAAGAKAADSDSGWTFTNQVQSSFISQALQSGVRRALYIQSLPQFFSLDTYIGAPVSELSKLGTLNYDAITEGWSCVGLYPTSTLPQGYGLYPSLTVPSKSDILVIGGAIASQNKPGVKESLPSNQLLQLLFNPVDAEDDSTWNNMNLPADPIYSSNGGTGVFLSYRAGPSQGNGMCYMPGCGGKSAPQDCTGP